MAGLSPFREQAMSALPPTTDSSGTSRHVRFVPTAEVTALLSNHLIDRRSLRRHRDACFPSTKLTSTPFLTDFANRSTSQFVILTQPCDSDLLTRDGSAVP
jgi:hypothetical protein